MNPQRKIETARLTLRRWHDSDREPFARINSDPRVMEYFPAPLTRAESDGFIARIEAHFEQHGFGLWAAELSDTGTFLGYIGLSVPAFQAHFTPCVEIGWRLDAEHWGHGLATEGASAVLDYAFTQLALPEVVSLTTPANVRSISVMEKLGMTRNPADDFDHPNLPVGHPLRRHVLHRKSARSQ
ncbi:MAG TPA: GNAT family N-acetyltransferase [Terracidiphilus sp.]|jgi:ribosomal-protein-alanine N-acetyltransferase|nr:GNAT family N-acetyltransferase [Terracidiphilus sp.]